MRRHAGRLTLVAMLASASSSFAQPAQGPAAPMAESTAAKTQFVNAQRLFKMNQFAEALPIFLDVAETTHSPNARLYVGHCLQQLGKNVDAYKAFAAVVKEVTEHPDAKYAQTREAAVAQLAVLNVRLARIVVSPTDIPPNAMVKLDAAVVEQKDLGSSIVVEPGGHRVEVTADGAEPMLREVKIDGGELKTVTFSTQKVPDEPAAHAPASRLAPVEPSDTPTEGGSATRTIGLVVGGAGIAGLAVFTITGLMAKNTFGDLEAQCPSGCADAGHLDQINRGKTLQTTANVGLAVGLLGVGTGATLFFLGHKKRADNPVSVSLSNGGGMVSYAGRF
jgi:hypothetical protein